MPRNQGELSTVTLRGIHGHFAGRETRQITVTLRDNPIVTYNNPIRRGASGPTLAHAHHAPGDCLAGRALPDRTAQTRMASHPQDFREEIPRRLERLKGRCCGQRVPSLNLVSHNERVPSGPFSAICSIFGVARVGFDHLNIGVYRSEERDCPSHIRATPGLHVDLAGAARRIVFDADWTVTHQAVNRVVGSLY
jgi:hypothetical protein